VNHFQKSNNITTKGGLDRNLKNSVFVNDVSERTYYPMSFNLNEEGGLADFIEEFKVFRAIGVIRKELNKVSNNSKSTNNSGNINEMD